MKSKMPSTRAMVRLIAMAAGLLLLPTLVSAATAPTPAPAPVWDKPKLMETFGKLPLMFEANRGQTDQQVKFLSRGRGYTLFLTGTEAVLALRQGSTNSLAPDSGERDRVRGQVLRMQFKGANPTPRASGLEPLPGIVNYFIGNDPKRWRTNIPTYQKVAYTNIYPGIDLIYYGNQRQLEYDFVVRPGADPTRIVLGVQGADRLEVDDQGDLLVRTAAGLLRQRKPVIYQEVDGGRKEIPGGYVLRGPHEAGFQVAAYDKSRPLVIDPVLAYSTYLGGSASDRGFGIAVDPAGNAYVTGVTASSDFPTTAGAVDTTFNGGSDAFVTKLDAAGSMLLYSTYLGGSSVEGDVRSFGLVTGGIAVDPAGNAYVTGVTASSDFPTTAGAVDTSFNGGSDTFVTKLDAAGSMLLYSTYLGDSGSDVGFGIAVDPAGNAYVTGQTDSFNFPTTPGSFDTSLSGVHDAFVTKLNVSGSALVYSTYLGGSVGEAANAIALDAAGSAYVTGVTTSGDFPTTAGAVDTTFAGGCIAIFGCGDAFVTKLDPAGSAPVYSTFLGGSSFDQGLGIAVDPAGNAYVTGDTFSSDFATTAGAVDTTCGTDGTCNGTLRDAFVTKLDPGGSMLLYSTYLGASRADLGFGIAVDLAGNAYVTGLTSSSDFPTTAGAVDTTFNGGFFDVFVTKLDPGGSMLLYSTYLGGSGSDEGLGIAVDPAGNAYVTGDTTSSFPTTPGAVDTTFNGSVDAFVTKLMEPTVGAPTILALSPAADTNPVGTNHTVTATVTDAAGNAVPGVVVRFSVTGSVSASGTCTTDTAGQCSFTYDGPELPGEDAITAYADTDNDNTQDAGEPTGAATKEWVLPATTPGCELSDNGQITAANTDPARFHGTARQSATGETSGDQFYQDRGPVHPLTVESMNVQAIACEDTTQADIFGQATIDGAGSFSYRIRVQDLGEPGKGVDTYSILLETGYSSGEQVLEAGNIQIRRR
jgi:beta-propeller repeat-containing protein